MYHKQRRVSPFSSQLFTDMIVQAASVISTAAIQQCRMESGKYCILCLCICAVYARPLYKHAACFAGADLLRC